MNSPLPQLNPQIAGALAGRPVGNLSQLEPLLAALRGMPQPVTVTTPPIAPPGAPIPPDALTVLQALGMSPSAIMELLQLNEKALAAGPIGAPRPRIEGSVRF